MKRRPYRFVVVVPCPLIVPPEILIHDLLVAANARIVGFRLMVPSIMMQVLEERESGTSPVMVGAVS